MYQLSSPPVNDRVDVVVVGAGYAGLTAARALVARGRDVCVLEARARAGGRIYTEHMDDGTPLDLGGQWIGPTQDRAIALAKEMGVDTFPTHTAGENLLCLGDRRKRYTGTIPKGVGPLSLLNIGWALWRLDRLAREVSLEEPWTSPRAREWDGTTLQTWLDRNVWLSTARRLVEIGLETVYSCEPADLSLLHALFYIKSGTSLETLINVERGAQQDRFVGGAQRVPDKMAEALGDRVRLGKKVREIEQKGEGVVVSGVGFRVECKYVIVAIPPPLASRIDYSPPLPGLRDQLTQRMAMGSVIKCMAIYETPFWRDDGLSGAAVIDEPPVHVTFDNSPPSGKPGIILGFIEAGNARKLAARPEAERREIVLDRFARAFGDRAKKPIRYVDKAWANDEHARGCYVALMPTGGWTSFGTALRAPVGRIHWAGTETATRWNGYMDGAIESGERAAREVLARDGNAA
jgi:monoamine oxidase